ncbi:hypothetical protein DFH09DRAFT_1088981 [Mycena vulgaris]|nr:hypothetical protein DFH09DRAFT_1088981 [Mycena vulgaris]
MPTYGTGSLYFLPSILDSTTSLGLHEGTLYDVPNIDPVPGNATVSASGFNVTCGYVVDVSEFKFSEDTETWVAWVTADFSYSIHATQSGMISSVYTPSPGDSRPSIFLYSTIPIVDSNLNTGPLVNLSPAMDASVSIQLFQCSLSLVNQTATVDTQSRQLRALESEIKKTDSKWAPYVPPPTHVTSNDNTFIDSWAEWYYFIPSSDFPLAYGSEAPASVADVYVIQRLNLPAANHNSAQNVTLHELENALSNIVAAIFWTLGHIRPTYRSGVVSLGPGFRNGTMASSLSDVPKLPILLQGNATVTEVYTQARLEVSAGLAISIILMLLALPSLLFEQGSDEKNPSVNGTGILHAIWMYRNHPELDALLEQVEHPTDDNLRAAGLVQTRLVGELGQKEWRSEWY